MDIVFYSLVFLLFGKRMNTADIAWCVWQVIYVILFNYFQDFSERIVLYDITIIVNSCLISMMLMQCDNLIDKIIVLSGLSLKILEYFLISYALYIYLPHTLPFYMFLSDNYHINLYTYFLHKEMKDYKIYNMSLKDWRVFVIPWLFTIIFMSNF